MDDYTMKVLSAMSLVNSLAAGAPDHLRSVPLVGGIELYVGATGYYPEPIAPFFCAPFCETLQ